MSDLGPEDEALLRSAREGIAATPDDHARVKRRLFAQLGIGVATGGSAIATSTGASAGATVVAGSSMITKILATTAIVGLLGGGAIVANHSRTHAAAISPPTTAMPNAQISSAEPSPAASVSPPVLDTSRPAPSSAPLVVDALAHRASPQTSDLSATPNRAAIADHPAPIDTTSAALPAQAIAATPNSVVQTAPAPIAVAGPATVDAEAALLRNADTELKAGRADHALSLLDQHAAQFPNGVLTEEREAERVAVLCALGRNSDAHDAATAFLSAHPRSPQAARIRASCGGN